MEGVKSPTRNARTHARYDRYGDCACDAARPTCVTPRVAMATPETPLSQVAKSLFRFAARLRASPPLTALTGESKQKQKFKCQMFQRSGVRYPALPHFLRRSGSGTGSTQTRDYN
jgi:hypothetical protein